VPRTNPETISRSLHLARLANGALIGARRSCPVNGNRCPWVGIVPDLFPGALVHFQKRNQIEYPGGCLTVSHLTKARGSRAITGALTDSLFLLELQIGVGKLHGRAKWECLIRETMVSRRSCFEESHFDDRDASSRRFAEFVDIQTVETP
jgi:hypothetical protein